MKIVLHPGEILAAFLAGSAVATGRFATNGSDKPVTLELGGVHGRGLPGQVNGESHARRQPVRCEPVHYSKLNGGRRSNTRHLVNRISFSPNDLKVFPEKHRKSILPPIVRKDCMQNLLIY
jgi:hypothetical protein